MLLRAAAKKWGHGQPWAPTGGQEVHFLCLPPLGQAVPNCQVQIRFCPRPRGLPGAQPHQHWLPRGCRVRFQAGSKPPKLNQPDLLAHNSGLTHSGWSPGEDGQGEETAIPPLQEGIHKEGQQGRWGPWKRRRQAVRAPENTRLTLATRPLRSCRHATLDQAASGVCLQSLPQCPRQPRC